MGRRIYVASSWRNERQPTLVGSLRDEGHEVYDFRNPPGATGFSWSEIDPHWRTWTAEEFVRGLRTPRAQAGFGSDHAGMEWADTIVLLLPCGRSAHLEAGWGCGSGRDVHILTRNGEEPELMYLEATAVHTSWEQLRGALASPASERALVASGQRPAVGLGDQLAQGLQSGRPIEMWSQTDISSALGRLAAELRRRAHLRERVVVP